MSLNILFASKPDLGLRKGGVQTQIARTAEALSGLGLKISFATPWTDCLRGADILHAFGCDESLQGFVTTAKARGIPVIVSPILNHNRLDIAKHKASRLPAVYPGLRIQRSILRNATSLCVLTPNEDWLIKKLAPQARTYIIPNGTDGRFFNASDSAYLDHVGSRPDVLFVGRIDENKNVLRLIQACEDEKLTLHIIGSSFNQRAPYLRKCVAAARDHVRFVGELPYESELLPSAYAATTSFALPSFREVFPLTAIEAAVAGAHVVLSRNSGLRNLFGSNARYCNPFFSASIRNALRRSLEARTSLEWRRSLTEMCSWQSIGLQLRSVYRDALTEITPNEKE